MSAHIHEWLNLIFRWFHLIAGIAWIGSSFFFMWLDRSVQLEEHHKDDEQMIGSLFMVHGGGFYEVEKRQFMTGRMPPLPMLHWFKWEAYLTWISGFFLLGIVYYMGGAAYLIDPSKADLTPVQAMMIGLSVLIIGWFLYDFIWRISPLGKNIPLANIISLALIVGTAYGLSQIFSGRGMFIHVGALLGTCMAGNVWRIIIPAQKKVLEAIDRGEEPDLSLTKHAKVRSTHNNYITFPVLFIMLSNHFPSFYGPQQNWLILLGMIVVGAGIKHFMNIKDTIGYAALGVAIITAISIFIATMPQQTPPTQNNHKETIKFTQIQPIIQQRCTTCHSANPIDKIFKVAPKNVKFDTPEEIKNMAQKIHVQSVVTKVMPLGNMTKMTDEERSLIDAWYKAGAAIK